MVFSSSVFIFIFFPLVFLINWILPQKVSNYFLTLASLIFYAWGEPVLVLLMIVSIALNWFVGKLLSQNGKNSKLILGVGIILNLLSLGYFKYSDFLVDCVNRILGRKLLPNPNVALPIGISFFTFQAISYIIDVYRKETDHQDSLINVALYISFFPQLIAGPIVKYKDINEQISSRRISAEQIGFGFRRFIIGLSKKVLIANVLGKSVDTIYSFDIIHINTFAAWFAAVCYTFQIYYDFSGYSDMAIGLAKMFGFNIPENFNYPYVSGSISEFWRRWHISLGSWFKDYVYIPLGGNRKGLKRTYLNLFVVFFLTGLWHGADFSYIFWGLYHGFFSILERLGLGKALKNHVVVSKMYCMLIVAIGWVMFRAGDTLTGLRMLWRMINPVKYGSILFPFSLYGSNLVIVVLALAVLGMGVIQTIIPLNIKNRFVFSVPEWMLLSGLLLLSICSIASNTYNPFIYFQF